MRSKCPPSSAPAKTEALSRLAGAARASALKPVREADVRAYNEAASVANLIDVRLISSEFSTKPRDDNEEGSASVVIRDRIQGHTFDAESGTSFTVFEWKIAGSTNRPAIDLRMMASFLLVYDGLSKTSPETVDRLITRVGRFASYPYFRTFVAQMSGMGCLELSPLPMLRDQVHAFTSVAPSAKLGREGGKARAK